MEVTMARIIKIETCNECPYSDFDSYSDIVQFCTIHDYDKCLESGDIPDWCPLEKVQ
jgi:hypothetical protein